MVTGVSLAAGSAFIAYPASAVYSQQGEERGRVKPLEEKYKLGIANLEDFNKSMNQIHIAVAALQEQVHRRGKRMREIFETKNETKICASYLEAQFVPTFDDFTHATIKLKDLCTDYLSIN